MLPTSLECVRRVLPEAITTRVSRENDYTAGGRVTVVSVLLPRSVSVDRVVDCQPEVHEAVSECGLVDPVVSFEWEPSA